MGWGKAKGSAAAPWAKGGGKWSAPVQQTIGKAAPWGKGKGKGGKDGKGKRKFTDLPEDQQQEIQAKWQARAEEEGRQQVGGTYKGWVVWRSRTFGWIAPTNPKALPKKVRDAMATMTQEFRDKCEQGGGKGAERFENDVLYWRTNDRPSMDLNIDAEMEVQFQVYVDSKGAGALNVEPA
mmetsp:Transcript_19845/g.45191  ORF Transcript_19845/g.45191 Transcript_19845/m.45191 type:complete len:180 (-) Transcript_19845:143-682(-)